MYIAFLILLVIWAIVINILDALPSKKSKDDGDTEKARCKSYIKTLPYFWGPALVVLILSFIGGISFADLGFRPISFNENVWFTVITLVVSALAFAYFVGYLILTLTSAKFREKQAADPAAAQDFPRTAKERKAFALLNFSSAICEEMIFRGFAAFLLQAVFPGIPILLIILITGAAFGLVHIYQGLAGIIETGISGMLLMALFLASGSLILPMILHFVINLSITFILSKEQGGLNAKS